MTLESDADRLLMLEALGEAVTVGGVTVNGIFDHEYAEVQGIEARRPVLLVRSSDAVGLGHNDQATAQGVNFLVKNIQIHGNGMTTLVLETT